jgi:hypothetical protein
VPELWVADIVVVNMNMILYIDNKIGARQWLIDLSARGRRSNYQRGAAVARVAGGAVALTDRIRADGAAAA